MMPPSLQATLEHIGATFIPYGPESEATAVMVPQDFGQYEAEYAAIRRSVGVLVEPQRGVLRFTGADCKDFLHRLTTQDVRAMTGGATRRAFQLNDKGRIIADMIIHHGDADTWLDMDVFDIPPVHQLLDSRRFGEDVAIEDWRDWRIAMALHGPATLALLSKLAQPDPKVMFDMPGTHHVLNIADTLLTAYRWDQCGVPGVRLMVPTEHAQRVYAALLEAAGFDADAPDPEADPLAAAEHAAQRRGTLRGRPVGWLAFNTARIEAGTAIFHIDFGTDCLPAETGLIPQAVSFTKGCYLGQEIVARMHNLGHPKRVLVGIRFGDDRLPHAGSPVLGQAAGGGAEVVVGGITSSAVSPMLGQQTIALAMVKWNQHAPGTQVAVATEGGRTTGVVQEVGFLG
ncbi:MAG: glycine cleavage T C-terminal barrel domain-containing protein [Phycisphaeraceae bacterium]